MRNGGRSRRDFLKAAGIAAGAMVLPNRPGRAPSSSAAGDPSSGPQPDAGAADYTLRIKASPVEIARNRFISATTYNGQFPGPLLRFKEGREVTIDLYNDTDVPEQLHWHGQKVSTDVDGASEEGTPFVPPRGKRRITFTPRPAGFRLYHTHVRAGANLAAGQYNGEVGIAYIEGRSEAGAYDREEFLVLKEFEPTFSRGGDMDQDILLPATRDPTLEQVGETAMKASLAKGLPKGYEVGYAAFTINGRVLGQGQPIRVKQDEHVLFHIVNGSATEIRSLALAGHTFRVVALDGNPVPNPAEVPVLWLAPAERISAIVVMRHPGVWILGDLDPDDRRHGMGIVVEYAGQSGKPVWVAPPISRWSYARFARPGATPAAPDQIFDMAFAKENAAEGGFNRWTINGVAYPMTGESAPAAFHLAQGKRYRIRMRNASDDIHPIHLHRHTFELTRISGKPMAGVLKDVFMLGGYQEAEVDFLADNPGLTLFHCHQQLHMDFGFMTLFDYL